MYSKILQLVFFRKSETRQQDKRNEENYYMVHNMALESEKKPSHRIKIYGVKMSSPVRSVLMACQVLNINHKFITVDLKNKEHFGGHFLQVVLFFLRFFLFFGQTLRLFRSILNTQFRRWLIMT